MEATHSRLWPPGSGVKPDHPTPSGRPPVLHDATDYGVGEHVEIVVVPFVGEARNRGALEDQRHDPKATIGLCRFTSVVESSVGSKVSPILAVSALMTESTLVDTHPSGSLRSSLRLRVSNR